MLNEMLADVAADGFNVPSELLHAKVAAALWCVPAVLDDDGRIVDFVSGQEFEWPPITN
jgi:hypothetical protein